MMVLSSSLSFRIDFSGSVDWLVGWFVACLLAWVLGWWWLLLLLLFLFAC